MKINKKNHTHRVILDPHQQPRLVLNFHFLVLLVRAIELNEAPVSLHATEQALREASADVLCHDGLRLAEARDMAKYIRLRSIFAPEKPSLHLPTPARLHFGVRASALLGLGIPRVLHRALRADQEAPRLQSIIIIFIK